MNRLRSLYIATPGHAESRLDPVSRKREKWCHHLRCVASRKAGGNMPIIVIIIIALSAGLFVGSHVESAHDAHQHFSSYRARTNASFGAWLKNMLIVGASIAGAILLLMALVQHGR